MATITDSKQVDIDGHKVDLQFFVFDTSEAIWTKDEREELDQAIQRLEGLGKLSKDQERALAKCRQQRKWMTGKPYRREHVEYHDYGWMMAIDGRQRMGIFTRFEEAIEQARELIHDP